MKWNVYEYHIARLSDYNAALCQMGDNVILCAMKSRGSLIAPLPTETTLPSCGAR